LPDWLSRTARHR